MFVSHQTSCFVADLQILLILSISKCWHPSKDWKPQEDQSSVIILIIHVSFDRKCVFSVYIFSLTREVKVMF